jgi:hypothetical protein
MDEAMIQAAMNLPPRIREAILTKRASSRDTAWDVCSQGFARSMTHNPGDDFWTLNLRQAGKEVRALLQAGTERLQAPKPSKEGAGA